MKANEIIHGGLYLIHDANDVVVRYDIVSNAFKSDYYEYPLALFNDDVCATDGDRFIFVKPIPLTEEILKANGLKWSGTWRAYCKFCEDKKFIMVTCDKEEGFGIHNTKIRFHYVHQLQHALRLCGLQELADNFIL